MVRNDLSDLVLPQTLPPTHFCTLLLRPQTNKSPAFLGRSSHSGAGFEPATFGLMSALGNSAGLRGARFRKEFPRSSYVEIGWEPVGHVAPFVPQQDVRRSLGVA